MKTKNHQKPRVLLFALSAFLLYGQNALAAQKNGNVSVEIVSDALSLTTTEVDFGRHTASNREKNITFTCDGDKSSADTVSGGQLGNDAQCGSVTIGNASRNTHFNVSIISSPLSAGNGNDLTADLQIFNDNGKTETSGRQSINPSQTKEYHIGGSLTIPADQAAGEYTGTYTFTATIQ